MERKEVKAVLFDLDGVLVDSIDAWFHIFNDTLLYFGKVTIPKRKFAKIFGMPIDVAASEFFDGSAIRQIEHIYIRFFEKNMSHFRLFPDAMPLLNKIREQKISMALITNSPKSMVMAIVEQCGINKYFNAVITIDDVKKGKPSPEMVLKACKLLKANPKNSILVGDTINDMIAGKRAGCITVGYKIKGDFRVEKLNDITRFLNQNPN